MQSRSSFAGIVVPFLGFVVALCLLVRYPVEARTPFDPLDDLWLDQFRGADDGSDTATYSGACENGSTMAGQVSYLACESSPGLECVKCSPTNYLAATADPGRYKSNPMGQSCANRERLVGTCSQGPEYECLNPSGTTPKTFCGGVAPRVDEQPPS